jgi:hydroxyacylglutathione hydrolase
MVANIRSFQAGQSVAHIIDLPSGLILVDAGSPGKERKIMQEVERMGKGNLRLIFITHAHFDHYGSAAAVRRLTKAPIAIHELDVDFMARGETPLGSVRGRGKVAQVLLPLAELLYRPESTRADIVFKDGYHFDEFEVEVSAMHLPGHTPGSSGLLVDHRMAFVGDLISSTGEPHAQRYYATDWSQIAQSLHRLKLSNPEWVYTGHGLRALPGDELDQLRAPGP